MRSRRCVVITAPPPVHAKRIGSFVIPPGSDVVADLSPAAYAMTIAGNALAPRFVDGDTIIVDPAQRPRPGCHVVAWPADAQGEPLLCALARQGEGADKAEPLATLHVVVAVCRKM